MGADSTVLFYDDLISTYADATDSIPRDWLFEEVSRRLALPNCRLLLIVGEPGAGKTGMMARLARSNPSWLRYFIRSNSTTPLSGGDAVSMMLRIGHQLAYRHPDIFDPGLLEIVVNQRVDQAGPGGAVVGAKIDELRASPFYRTAIAVQQDVKVLADRLVGVEIALARPDPRLLEPDMLGYMALLDPASVLADKHPNETIVVLVDALDEVSATATRASVLDWLETGPALPANVRFVVSSRSFSGLRTLEGVREGSVQRIDIESYAGEVAKDVRNFAIHLFENTHALAQRASNEKDAIVNALCTAARGNFAYLTAYARSLRAALESRQLEALEELLDVAVLPSGLHSLYATFVRRMRRQIEGLGRLDVAASDGSSDGAVPAWQGVGQRLFGVLTVAREALSTDQLMRLGAIRVWKSAANDVLQILRPFLDESQAGWQFFHPSLGDFLAAADKQPDTSDIAVDAREWNTRIIAYYKGASDWNTIDWSTVDDYGLRHVADHLAAVTQNPRDVSRLVTRGLKFAIKDRFHNDLPFRRVIEIARTCLESRGEPAARFCDGVFLELVREGLSHGAARLDPAVYGLMARLGATGEAMARAQVMEPGLHKFRAIEAIQNCASAEQRDLLGPNDGVEYLASAALEVPAGESSIAIFGISRDECLKDAAIALARYDVDRALHLADLVTDKDVHNEVLAAAAQFARTDVALDLLSKMSEGRASAALAAASLSREKESRDRLIAFAMQHVDEEPVPERLSACAQLIALGADAEKQLQSTLKEAFKTKGSAQGCYGALIDAARALHDSHTELAAELLSRIDPKTIDSATDYSAVSAAELWASWKREKECRGLLEKALAYYRSLGWYGPARDIVRVASVARTIDPSWAEQLAREAIELVTPELESADTFARSRLDGTLSGMAQAFKSWDRERALQVAHWLRSSWIPGGSWDSMDGRAGALAVIGLDAVAGTPQLARALLAECLEGEDRTMYIAVPDPQKIGGQLYDLADEDSNAAGGSASNDRTANFIAYITNELNYWSKGRAWRFFHRPAELLQSLEYAFFPRATWARAVVSAIASIAATDLDRALALTAWLTDPCDTLVALAQIAGAREEHGDSRVEQILSIIDAKSAALPKYAPAIDLDKIEQQPLLMYLNPAVRSRFEAAIALPLAFEAVARSLAVATRSWYVAMVMQAERLFRHFCIAPPDPAMSSEQGKADLEESLRTLAQSDDLLSDLVRAAYVRAVAIQDIECAQTQIAAISNPSVRTMAQLTCLPYEQEATSSLRDRSLQILQALGEDVPPSHRAELAGIAAALCTGEDAAALLHWGEAAIGNAGALFEVRGAIALSVLAPGPQRTALLNRALALADTIGNQYVRDDALADILSPVVSTGDPRLLSRTVDRLIASAWRTFSEGLRRAMPAVIAAFGSGIVEAIDDALRNAQDVLAARNVAADEFRQFNGVRRPQTSGEPLKELLMDPNAHYLSLYLDQSDLPALKCVQDSRLQGPDPGDEAFSRLHGRNSGLAVWLGEPTDAVWRLVDIRFLFDNAEDAAAYHRERLPYNTEGAPPVSEAPLVGEECSVTGGTQQIPGTGISITAFAYIFRVGNVVVKLFVAQGPDAAQQLSPADLVPLAERIIERAGGTAASAHETYVAKHTV